MRITTAKKAFRREDIDPNFLARLERRDIVEIPMGQPFPSVAAEPTTAQQDKQNDWLPDTLHKPKKVQNRKHR